MAPEGSDIYEMCRIDDPADLMKNFEARVEDDKESNDKDIEKFEALFQNIVGSTSQTTKSNKWAHNMLHFVSAKLMQYQEAVYSDIQYSD